MVEELTHRGFNQKLRETRQPSLKGSATPDSHENVENRHNQNYACDDEHKCYPLFRNSVRAPIILFPCDPPTILLRIAQVLGNGHNPLL